MRYLFLLIIAIPAFDLGFLLLIGKTIGVWATIVLIIFTGIIGAYLAKKEGLQTIQRVQEQLNNGEIPGEAVIDGICILIGGVLLLTPGFITDLTGFLLLFPPSRKPLKFLIIKTWQRKINKRNIKIIN
ncbi:MAG: membrane protein FxsA [Bacillus sp. (in: Bacteria)]|nr:membrane protein FxsA [Bacillus sp. (in: firmicutes)]